MPFDQNKADIAVNFFERVLKHSGEWYGDPFLLAPWQEDAIQRIFGLVDDNGERLIRLAYLEVPKKTGKTELVAGLVLLFLVMDQSKGCEVYGAASSQRQAGNVFRAACAMVEQSPILQSRLRIMRSTHRIVRRSDPNSFYAAIAADGDLTDGVNPKFVVGDELHRWRTRKQVENWDVLRLGGISRKHSTLTVAITTAGVQTESPLAWRLHEKTRKIAEGVATDDTFYGRIYSADPKDDWEDEATWIKANPSLKENGGFLDIAKIRQEYESCKSEPDGQMAFRRYYLNLWDEKIDRAVDMRRWHACRRDWDAAGWPLPHELLKRFVDRRCWVGVDLSMTTDLSAVSCVFPREDGGYDVLPFAWLPEAGIRRAELRDGMPYQRWVREGFLETTPGEVIDMRAVRARLDWCYEMFDVQQFCFDRFNSREMSTQLMEDGRSVIEVPQNFTGLNEATKKFLGLVATGDLVHGGHPVLAHHASCLSLKSDGNDLVRPQKPARESDSARIDTVAATIDALALAIVAEAKQEAPRILFTF